MSHARITYGLILFLLVPSFLSAQVSQASLDRAQAKVRSEIEAGKVAGAAHLVVQGGKVVLFDVHGHRDIEEGSSLAADTIVRIYSMTKPITSVAAMQLYEQDKFKLDDPVSKFIPAFEQSKVLIDDGGTPSVVPAERPLTVRDLFRHTSGYSYGSEPQVQEYYEREGVLYRPPYEMLPPAMTIEKAAEALARIPALHHPGRQFTYGLNTDILGRLIEVWSSSSLDNYLKENIFQPLEMTDTAFDVPVGKRNRFASCHVIENGKLIVADKNESSPFQEGFEFLSGGGGLVSTINDYANFCQMLVDDGQFKKRRIIQPDTLRMMFTDQLNGVAGDFQFGLGFAISDVTLGTQAETVKQYAWAGYASTDFRIVPEKKLFQIFVRQLVPSSHELANEVFQIVYSGMK